MERLNSGEVKTIFRNSSQILLIGLIASGKHAWQLEEEIWKDSSTVLILQEPLCISELFREHSGRNLIDPLLQDNVVFQSNFFQYIYHVGCAFNLHSIISSGLTLGGQNLNNRQTVFFLLVYPMDKNHKDLDTIDLNAPRHAQYMHESMEETSEHTVFCRHQSCSEERIEVLSDSIERYHSSRNTSSLLYSERW